MMLWVLQVVAAASATAASVPVHLRVEGLLESVAVISEPNPRFSFLHGDLASPSFGVTQASYHITVEDADATGGAPLWDSGDVKSSNCSQIVYAGKALAPFTRYTWTVEWTSSAGDKSAQATSRFETGPMAAKDWQGAGWLHPVGAKSQFRNEFSIPAGKKVAFARAYVAAAGCAHVEVNGKVPQPDLRGICPWPVSTASVRYVTHDITALVISGKNALGIVAGSVMKGPQATLIVAIKFQDETAPTFPLSSSSAGWMATDSYVTTATAWDSAIDWTKHEKGWSTTSFSPSASWSTANASHAQNLGQLSARALAMPLSTVLEEVKPTSVLKTADGGFLYTFPKNFVGTIQFQPLPSAASGSNLTVLLGEWLVSSMPHPKPPTPTPKAARCGRVAEKQKLALACPDGKKIDSIVFASYGTPEGSCPAGFKDGKCSKTGKIGSANQSLAVVEKACVGKKSCVVDASNAVFGGTASDPCPMVVKSLAAEVHCSGDPPGATCTGSCYNGAPPPPPTPGPPAPGADTFPKISGGKQQYENHVLRAGNTEPISTLFCWHGFQYVRVTPEGYTSFTGALDAIVGLAIHTNMTATGSLTFGGEGDPAAEDAAQVLTHINEMTLQSQRTNVAAYMPTDCPTREKHGWMGDALDGSEQALYNFEMDPVHEAFMQVVEDNQNPTTGDVPVVVPGHAGSCDDIAWTSAYPQITAMQHRYYGNTRTLARKFPSLVRYQENLISNADSSASNAHEGLAVCDQFKDWLCGNAQSCCTHKGSPTCPVGAEMGGFNYVLGLRAMAEMATVLGNTTAATRYTQYATKGAKEFHSYFYNTKVGRYGGDVGATQSLSLPALKIGSAPASILPNIVKTVGDDLQSINYTLSVGAVTSKILFNMLSENGLHEAALRTAINTEEPSIGHWWKKWNATTCYEAFPNTNSPTNPSGTLNHIFLCGGIGHWMWKHLVGLTPAAPGFGEVSLIPRIHDSVGPKSVGGQFTSPKGVISSSWKLSAGTVSLSVNLPVGVAAATIVVPKPTTNGKPAAAASIKLHGTVVWDGSKLVGKPSGILSAVDQPEGVAFSTTNGAFEFESTAKTEWLAIL